MVAAAARRKGDRPPSRSIHAMCVHDGSKLLRYIREPSLCNEEEETAIKLPQDGPMIACRVTDASAAQARRNSKRPHYPNVATGPRVGSLFLARRASDCRSGEKPFRLSPASRQIFCAELHDGGMRWVSDWHKCRRWEFAAALPAHHYGPVRARDDQATSDQDTAKDVNVVGNDRGPGHLRVQSLDRSGEKGGASIQSDSTVRWSPNGQFNSLGQGQTGTDVFRYTVTNSADSDSGRVTIKVTGKNDNPKALADSADTTKQDATEIPVLTNDSDPDNADTLHVGPVNTAGTKGKVTVSSDGKKIEYDPNGQFKSLGRGQDATDKFRYRATDSHGANSNEAQVTVTIHGVNDPPTVSTSPGNTAYTENDPATVVDGGVTPSDPDDANLVFAEVSITTGLEAATDELAAGSLPSGLTSSYNSPAGTLTISGTASIADYQTALRSVTFHSTSDNPATSKAVEFRVNDGGSDSSPATKHIDITRVNDAPTVDLNGSGNSGIDVSRSFTEDSGAASAAPAAEVSDPDDTNLEGATVTLTTRPDGNAESLSASTAGTSITATPYDSSTGTITLTGSDTKAHYRAVLRSLSYLDTSDTPTTTDRNVDVKVNDGDVDSATAHSTISVTAHNDAPTATDQNVSADEDTSLPVTLSGTDPEGDSLTFTHGDPSHGSLSGSGASLTYKPDADYFGSDSFTFTADDGNGGTDTGTISITVNAVNDAPVVDLNGSGSSGIDISRAFTEDSGSLSVAPAADVSDVDDTHLEGATITLTTRPDGNAESLSVSTAGTSITASPYDSSTGTITLSGHDTKANYQAVIRSLSYLDTSDTPTTTDRNVDVKVNDGDVDSATAKATISVTAHNDAPSASGDTYNTNEDTPLTVAAPGVLGNDSDPEGSSITAVLDSGPSHASSFTLNSDGSFSYTPNPDFASGDSFTYHATDGSADSATVTVIITVSPVNDAPVVDLNGSGTAGNDTTASFTEDSGSILVAPAADVSDVDDTNLESATLTLTNHPDGAAESLSVSTAGTAITASSYNSGTGVLTLSGSDTKAHYQSVIRSLSYLDTSDTPDTADRVVNVKVNDGDVDSNEPHSTISVTAHNDAPVAVADGPYSTDEDTPLTVAAPGVLSNDSDPEGSSITAVLDTGPAHASSFTLNSDGSFSYTPSPDYNGSDSFTYHANDGTTDGNTVTVSLTINAVNDAPVNSVPASVTTSEDTAFTFQSANALSVNDVDAGSGTINVQLSVSHGTLTLGNASAASTTGNGTGTVSLSDTQSNINLALAGTVYTPDSNYNGDDTLTTATDDNGNTGSGGSKTDSDPTTIHVTAVNDPPVATADSYSTNEDTPLSVAAPGVLGNDSDTEGSSLTAVLDSGPAHAASFTLNSDGSFGYTPALDYNGPDSFTYHPNDGTDDGNTVTVSLTVNAVNDAPVVDLDTTSGGTGSTATFNEVLSHDNSVAVAPNADVTDVDNADIDHASIQLTNRPNGISESLSVDTSGTSVSASAYDPVTGTISLTNPDTKANYAKVIKTLTYANTAAPPNNADRQIDVKVNDGSLDSSTATATVHVVPIDVPPVVDLNGGGSGSDNSAAFTEDSPAVAIAPSATVTDSDTPNLASATVTLTNHPDGSAESLSADTSGTSITADSYDSSTGVLLLHGSDTQAHYQQVVQSVTYNNTSNTPDTTNRDVTVKANDGIQDSNTAHSIVSVTAHNDAPTLDLNGSSTAGVNETAQFTEDQSSPTTLAPNTLVGDVDNTTLQSATITLANHPDGSAESLGTNTSGTSITATSYNSSTGVLALNGSDTLAHYQQVLQSVGYNNTSQNPDATDRTVDFKVNDGTSDSNSPTVTVTIHVVNDPPVVDMNGGGGGIDSNAAFTEDSAPANPGSGPVNLGSSATVSDVDNANLNGATLTLTNHPDGVNESLSVNVSGTSITTGGYNSSTGVLTLIGTDTTAHYQQVIRSAQYNNVSNTPDPTNRDVTIKVTDPSAADSTVAHTTISVTPTNDAPVANADTFNSTNSAVGNTTLNVNDTATTGAGAADGRPATPDPTDTSPVTDRPHKEITGNIFANDTDPDSPSSGFTATPGLFATNDGGTVTIQADGDFNFEPAPSTSCTDHSDFFNYTVNDNNSGGNASSTGTVTVAISGCVWYVNNDDAQGNSGTSEKPFDTLAQAQTASGTSDSIFVYDGNDSSTGYNAGIILKNSQQLIGEAATLTVGSDTLHSGDPANRPTLSNNNLDVVSLANGNTLEGLGIDPQGTGGGICGGTACGGNATAGGTLDDVNITDTGTKGTQPGLELNGSTGTFNISNLTVNNGDGSSATTGDEGVKLNNAGTVNFASTGAISITTNGAAGLDAAAGGGTTSLGSASTFDDITVTNSSNGGVLLNGTTGSGTAYGDGSGNDLQLTTTSGSTPAFSAQTSGSFSIPSAGQSDISATGGPAVDVVSSSGSTMAFDGVSSTNSANDGINIDSIGTGTFSATSGTVGGEAGIGFDLNGGSGAITYPGTFNNGSGPLVAEVTGRTGGVVSLSGSMNDTNDAGGGIDDSGNSGGSTVYSGATKTYNTGASDALTISNPDGSTHTAVWSGGGTAITTTSGTGVNATGVGPNADGNLQFSGTGNTIDSGSGRAFNMTDVNATATGMTFQHIASNGATNGIRMSDVTGSTANQGLLAVTGTGSANSGGTITNSTGAGIDLTNVSDSTTSGYAFSGDQMAITNGGDDGIRATSVGTSAGGGIKLSNSSVTGNGTAATAGENGIDGSNLLGNVDLVSDTVSNSGDTNVEVSNDSGTVNVNVNGAGSAYSGAKLNEGIQIQGTNTGSQNLTVQGTSANPIVFANNKDSHIQSTSDSANTTNSTVTIDHTSMTEPDEDPPAPNTNLGGGITVNHGGNANVDTYITNNNIQNSIIGAIAIDTTGSVNDQQAATIDATIQNNTIGTAGNAASGSSQGNGIFVSSNGAGHVRTLITGNSVREWTNRNGLELDDDDGPAQLDATVHGNTFTEPNSAFTGTQTRGFTFQLGAAQAGDNIHACLDIGDSSNSALKNQVAGDGESPQPDIRWLYEGPSTGGPSAVTLANYSGPSNPTITDIASYLQPRNNVGGTPTVSGTAVPTGSHSVTSVASCPLPAP